MIYTKLQVIAICFLTIPLSGQDMFPARQLTFDPAQQGFATWSSDGKKIAFTRTQGSNFDIWVMEDDTEKIKKKLQIKR
jgi:Tol biopolymer transport system component